MTKADTAAILAVFKIAYPRYYSGKTEDEIGKAISLWHSMLAEYPAELVNAAVKALIATSPYPPTIADVIARIGQLTTEKGLSEVEAWGLVKTAIRDSAYHSTEEFDRLPDDIKATIGSANVLREWALADDGSTETVIASNFMRSYKAKVKERKDFEAIPTSVKALLIKNSEKLSLEVTKNAQ